MGNKLLTQIVLIVTSIVIVVTYIRPSFEEIAVIQDDIAKSANTVARAAELNAVLQDLIATERSLSQREMQALQIYLPREISEVVIMRDIQNIFKIVNLPITALSAAAAETRQTRLVDGDNFSRRSAEALDAPTLSYRDFKLTFFGQYADMRLILESLEMNAYPLEIVALNFTSAPDPNDESRDIGLEPGEMKYDLTLRAYALSVAQ